MVFCEGTYKNNKKKHNFTVKNKIKIMIDNVIIAYQIRKTTRRKYK